MNVQLTVGWQCRNTWWRQELATPSRAVSPGPANGAHPSPGPAVLCLWFHSQCHSLWPSALPFPPESFCVWESLNLLPLALLECWLLLCGLTCGVPNKKVLSKLWLTEKKREFLWAELPSQISSQATGSFQACSRDGYLWSQLRTPGSFD